MKIKVINWGSMFTNYSGINSDYIDDAEVGLHYISLSKTHYDVIDKQLFFLSVIKYGIEFEEIKSFKLIAGVL